MNLIFCHVKRSPRVFNGLTLLRYSSSSMSSGSSVIESKVDYFDNRADNWWDPSRKGSMNHLHLLDPYRIKFISDQIILNPSIVLTGDSNKPLRGAKILDVGCGVGTISEKLAIMGADVTGLEPAERLVKAAKRHASLTPAIEPRLRYLASTAEAHASSTEEKYNAILLVCIIEHLQNKPLLIDSCLQLLKPNGSLLIVQCNSSFVSRFSFCFWNPYVLKLYPKNLLNYELFITNAELLELLYERNCRLVARRGLKFNWIGRGASLTTSNKHFNMMHLVKN